MKRNLACVSGLGLLLAAALALGGCPGAGGDLTAGASDEFDPNNTPPSAAASAAPSSGVRPGTVVTLDASASSDPDGDELSFTWWQSGGPEAALSSDAGAAVTFEAPYAVETSQLSFVVEVNDHRGGVVSANVSVVVEVGSEFAGYWQTTAPYRDSLTSDEAYHLLKRAAFGATPDQVAAAVQRGLAATVEDLLAYKPVAAEIEALARSYEDDMPKRWLVYLIESPNPLYEKLALFWHDRFATSRRVLEFRDRNLAIGHWEMLRANALGSYRAFLEALTLDPLMLIWLDGANSPKDSPNENYAREFWELFTLGRDVLYTEADIREGARAFTGITLLRASGQDARPIFDLRNHDETPKLIFPGRTAGPLNYDYEQVIDLTLAQPEAARYVARNLFVYFVHEQPSDEVVQELADEFAASGFQIAPVVRRILRSQALFSSAARNNRITGPVEHCVGVFRTLDMHVRSEDAQGYVFDRLRDDLAGAGQELLNPPGVEGWTEGPAWLQEQWVLNRVRALSRTMEYGPSFTDDLPYHLLPSVSTWNQREVRGQMVDAIAAAFHVKLSPEERDVYIEVLDQGGWKAFHLEDPRYQPYHVFEMIRLMAMDERVVAG
jgi:hypothetical protein